MVVNTRTLTMNLEMSFDSWYLYLIYETDKALLL